jgi:hypothetical protein
MRKPQPDPHIRRIVDLFTQRDLDRVAGVVEELDKCLKGDMHSPALVRPPRPAGLMVRWSPAEVALTRVYLRTLPPEQFTYDDWNLLIDYLVQRYLPPDDMRTEAEWLATRSNLMGRIEAARGDKPLTLDETDHALASLPDTPVDAEKRWGLTAVESAVLAYGNAHCAETITGITDEDRRCIRRCIMDFTEAKMLGNNSDSYGALETRLFDEFGELNLDWRQIAHDEVAENEGQGLIASLAPGDRVMRVEKYRGVCSFCKSIDGRIVTIVAPDAPEKDGDNEIWVGKNNSRRLATHEDGDDSEKCESYEKAWIAAGLQHPGCRGTWIHLAKPTIVGDPVFSTWLDETLGRT